ncbi:MAG: hypothetical protein FWG37_07335, partial [Clostridia bacterium]|nr:hypothetical protein [Clostridia bacterium]
MMREKQARLIAAVLCAVSLTLPIAAFTEPIAVCTIANPNELYMDGGTVAVAIAVTHGNETEKPISISLADPDENIVFLSGTDRIAVLNPGETRIYLGQWDIMQTELAEGAVFYTAYYTDQDTVSRILVPVCIETKPLDTGLSLERTIEPLFATEGETVTIRYSIKNDGSFVVQDIVIEDPNIIDSLCIHSLLLPGEETELSYAFTADSRPRMTAATLYYRC